MVELKPTAHKAAKKIAKDRGMKLYAIVDEALSFYFAERKANATAARS